MNWSTSSIGSEPFIEHWTNKWSDMLQVNRKFLGDVGAKTLRDYIRNAVATNMPYDKFAYGILTATGSNADNGPASYYKMLRTPDAAMENTTHLFLAIRFNCNKCHDHPFERWTQDQYYNLASYFAQVDRTARSQVRRAISAVRPSKGACRSSRSSPTPTAAKSRTTAPARWQSPSFPSSTRTCRQRTCRAACNWRSGSPRKRTPTSPRAT